MNIYLLFSLLASLGMVYIGNFVYYKDPRNQINQTYFVYTILGAFVGVMEALARISPDPNTALFWYRVGSVWPFFPAISLHLILLLREKIRPLKSQWIYILIYGPAVLISVINMSTNLILANLAHRWWGWVQVPANTMFTQMVSLWFAVMGIAAIWLAVRVYRQTSESSLKSQTMFVLIGVTLPVFVNILTEGILPSMGYHPPSVSQFSFLVGSLLLGYGIWKYKLYFLSPVVAARSVFSTLADALIITNRNNRIVMINQSAGKLLHYSEEELLGQPISRIFTRDPEIENGYPSHIWHRKDTSKEIEISLVTREGNEIPVSLTFSVTKDPYSNDEGIVYICRDLTEQHRMRIALEQASANLERRVRERTDDLVRANTRLRREIVERAQVEQALRESEKDYRELFEGAHDAILIFKPEGEIVLDVNDRACEMYGFNRNEFIGMSVEEVSANVDQGKSHIQQTLEAGFFHTFESRHMKKNGEEMIVEINASALDFRGQEAIQSINRDVTERRKTEDMLRRTQFAVDRARDAVFWVGADARILYVNNAACNTLGYTKDELLSMNIFELDPAFPTNEWDVHWDRSRDVGSYTIETTHLKKDGNELPVEIAINFMVFDGKEYHIDFSRDLTDRKETEEELRQSEYLLKQSQEIARIGHYSLDVRTAKWESSETLDAIMGIESGFNKTIETWLQIVHRNHRQELKAYFENEVLSKKQPFNYEYKIRRLLDNKVRWVHGLGRLEFDENGEIVRMIGTIQDITERREAEESLRLSEARLSEAQRIAHIGHWDWDISREKLYWSDEVYRIFETNPKETTVSYEFFINSVHPDDVAVAREAITHALESGQSYSVDHRIVTVTGEVRHIYGEGEVTYDKENSPVRMHGIVQDITDIKQADAQLRSSLEEKEILLKEIHHRVKNNMQVISSLLSLQSRTIKDRETLSKFIESENRIRAMSLIHEKLYQTENLSSINFADYIPNLARYLFSSYSRQADRIKLQLDIEPIALSIDTSIPCGLIINEVISNALKYAFPDEQRGEIMISFHRVGSGNGSDHTSDYQLTISDNGIGMSKVPDLTNIESLGLKLIHSLVKQLNGTVDIHTLHGTEFQITFQDIYRSTLKSSNGNRKKPKKQI